MIKKIIFPLLTLFSLNMYAQVTFQKTYGYLDQQDLECARQTYDGGYIMAGSSTNASNQGTFVIKTNVNGDTAWTKIYNSANIDFCNAVWQCADGGYIIAGDYYGGNGYLIRINSLGDTIWTRTYSGIDARIYSVIETSDSGFLAAGYLWSGSGRIWLFKANSAGNILWSKTYRIGIRDFGESVQQTTDGGYIVAGFTQSALEDSTRGVYLIKTAGSGNVLWSKIFGGTGEYASDVRQTVDGGYIIAALSGLQSGNPVLIKTDATGTISWSKVYTSLYGSGEYFVRQTSDGGYIMAGGNLVKTDSMGTVLWANRFWSGMKSVELTTDGGYIVGGTYGNFFDFYLIKTDNNGHSGCNETVPTVNTTAIILQAADTQTIVNTLSTSEWNTSFVIGSGSTTATFCANPCIIPSAKITAAGPTTFCSGDNVVLNAPPGANKTYQWQKGGVNIPGATSSAYSATIGGNYKVIVTNTVTGCFKTTSNATTVTVNPLPNATITPQGPTTFCAGGSVLLKANYGAGYTYQWKKGGNNIGGATLKNYTASIAGVYKVKETNSYGCSKLSAGVTISVPCKEEEVTTSLTGFNVSIFPNPAHSEINVVLPGNDNFEIEIVSTYGSTIIKAQNQNSIDISKLANGIYFLKVLSKDHIVTQKFIKQ